MGFLWFARVEVRRSETGSCHCGQVAFEVDAEIAGVATCNCSICTKKGYVHWIVPRERFRLLRGAEGLSTYSFNTGVARHQFCSQCGVAAFYVPRSEPEKIDVNLRCVDDIVYTTYESQPFDGRNWEDSIAAHRRDRVPGV